MIRQKPYVLTVTQYGFPCLVVAIEFKESSPARFATAVINSLGSTGFGTKKIG